MSSPLFASAAAGKSVLVSETGVERLQFVVRTGTSVFPVGGSASKKGDDLPSGPGPYNLLNAALATCTATTIRLYAERKGYRLTRIQVSVGYRHASSGSLDSFDRVIHLEGDLTEEQTARLLQAANLCPVGKTLRRGADIQTTLSDEDRQVSDDEEVSNYVEDAETALAEMEDSD
jgi:putative redox protein